MHASQNNKQNNNTMHSSTLSPESPAGFLVMLHAEVCAV